MSAETERYLADDHELAIRATTAVRQGDTTALGELLTEHPELAVVRIGDPGCSRTMLHIATDWPGNFPHVADTIRLLAAAGANPDAPFDGAHTETPLHWAASCDDVEAVDALLDLGADIEAPGSVLGGGTPLADACGFAQWNAARRLVERGASTRLGDAAALGLMDRLEAGIAADPAPNVEDLTVALWSACSGAQRAAVTLLVDHGADLDWIGWNHQTGLDVALEHGDTEFVQWLRDRGARRAAEIAAT
jgi:uncharacterized protein